MIDAVVSYHLGSLTCGTAKWNARLAQQLGVPLVAWDADWQQYQHPLFSLKPDEIDPVDARLLHDDLARYVWRRLEPEAFDPPKYGSYDLLLHSTHTAGPWNHITWWASTLSAANPTVCAQLSGVRGDAQTIWCPSSLSGNPERGYYNVLTYGMAHKLTAPYYEQLERLLDKAHPNYTISLSTAVHEGSPWDESLQRASGLLRDIFGRHLRVLGYLADDALARELAGADAVALFYDPAVRANNTTAWAALEAGKPLVTNLDEDSPPEMNHRVIHLPSLQHWPFQHVMADYAREGQKVAQIMNWDRLVGVLNA